MNLENIHWEIMPADEKAYMNFTMGNIKGVCCGWYLDFKYIQIWDSSYAQKGFDYEELRSYAVSDGKEYIPLIKILNYFDSNLDEQVQGHKRDVAINKNHEDYTWGRI